MNRYFPVFEEPSVVWVNNSMIQTRVDSQYYKTVYVENEYKMEGIGYEKLSDIIERGDYGILPDTEDYGNIGVPLIRGTDLRSLAIEIKEMIRVPKTYLSEKSQLKHKDIMLLIKGATIDDEWSVSIVPQINEEMIFNGSIFRIRLKSNYDPYFITTFMSTNYFLLQKTRAISNTGIYYNDKDSIENFLIPIPSPEIQKYIGDKLRRAEGLREEAKKLRKKAESFINGKIGILKTNDDSQYSSAFISSSKIIDRIDSEYYNTKYLRIEKEFDKMGYETKTLNELCNRIFNGKTYSTTNVEGRYFNIGVGELGDWFISKNNEKLINDTINKRYCLNKNSIVWGNAAHLAKYIGEKVNMIFEDDIVIPTTEVTAIEPNEEVIDSYYLYLFMRSKWGYYQIQRTVKGMTAHSYPQDIGKILVPIINLTNEEKEEMKDNVVRSYNNEILAQQLIQEAKQDVEDLIEGNFHMSKLSVTTPESR